MIKSILNTVIFVLYFVFLTKFLTLNILFSTIVNAVFVAKLLTSGILFPNSVSFAYLTRLLTSGILFSNSILSVLYLVFNRKSVVSILFPFPTNLSYTVFLTISFFTTSLSLLESTGIGANLSMSNLSTLIFKLAKFLFAVSGFMLFCTCEVCKKK